MEHELTREQQNAINALKRLANRWPAGIWVYCTGNAMHVLKCGENGEHVTNGGSPDTEYEVAYIDGIDHDGGDF